MHDLQPLLATHPFFAGLDPKTLALVTGCASNVKFDAGQRVFKEGEEADQFYIVRQGRIAVEAFSPTRGPLVIQTVEEGDILGWSWLVAPYKWRFDAHALDLTRAIALDLLDTVGPRTHRVRSIQGGGNVPLGGGHAGAHLRTLAGVA